MYRRNITHLLIPLAIGLVLIIGYHLFIKPHISLTPAEHAQSEGKTEVVTPPPPPPHEGPHEAEPRSVRLLDHSTMPDTTHVALLEVIRDEIDKHDLPLAESKLNALPATVLSNGKTKPFVAILWNNLALLQEQQHGTKASVLAFKKAADLDDSNPVILMNLAHAYWAQRDRALNADFLTKLMNLAPREPFPHVAMADLLQEQDRLAEAATHLAHARDRAQADPALRSYLAAVTAKVQRTESVEARMTTRNSTHFVVKFNGEEDQTTWTTVLEILEEAYREIGQKFSHFPSRPIIVVLHTQNSFQGATGSPVWADGLYDPTLGRIQIPTQGATTDMKWLTAVLRHEYVHALLHDRLGGSSTLPTWLNEGLAMQLAGGTWSEVDQSIQEDFNVIPLTYLESSWGALPANTAIVAYLEANSATHYLIERWGMSRVDGLLESFKANTPMATAIQNKLFVTYEQFHRQWLESFERHRS